MVNIKNQKIMKKIYSYVIAAAAMLAAASCQEIVEPAVKGPEAFSLTAVAGVDTKTTLVDGVKTYWTPGDELTVFDANGQNQKFVTDITEPAASAVFSTETFAMPEDMNNAVLLAIYPYAEGAVTNFQTYVAGLEIPMTQQAVKNGFDPDASIAYALAMGEDAAAKNLKFHNLYGLFKFTVGDAGVTKVTIRSNGAEVLSGAVTLLLNGTITAAGDNVHEVILEGTFEKGGVYYVAGIPGVFKSGITVLYNDTEVKSTDKEFELKANTVLNLGEIATPALEPSGWTLPGGYNSWNTTATPLYDDGDYYVAKNVMAMGAAAGQSAGFKFQHPDFGWKGVASTSALAAGEWHKLNGDANISLDGNVAYDIYMTKDGRYFQALAAGSAVPEAPVEAADYWGIIGSMASSNWATDLLFNEEGDYLVYKGLELTTSHQFQIRKNSEWADAKIASANPASADTEYNLVAANSNNMKVATAGTYDVYMTKDITKVYFMTAGKTPSEAGQSDYYRFYVQNNVGWSTLNFYAWGGYASAGWPGDKMTLSDEVEGYGTCKYIEIAKGTSVVNFIVNNGSKQTNDLKVSNNANVKKLSNGDYIYILTSTDVKK